LGGEKGDRPNVSNRREILHHRKKKQCGEGRVKKAMPECQRGHGFVPKKGGGLRKVEPEKEKPPFSRFVARKKAISWLDKSPGFAAVEREKEEGNDKAKKKKGGLKLTGPR